eukprot:Em0006g1066a
MATKVLDLPGTTLENAGLGADAGLVSYAYLVSNADLVVDAVLAASPDVAPLEPTSNVGPIEESESQYQVRDSCEDDPCAFDYDTVEYESEEEELLDADVNSDDDHETYYPFPSKLFVILYMLVKDGHENPKCFMVVLGFEVSLISYIASLSMSGFATFCGVMPESLHLCPDGGLDSQGNTHPTESLALWIIGSVLTLLGSSSCSTCSHSCLIQQSRGECPPPEHQLGEMALDQVLIGYQSPP